MATHFVSGDRVIYHKPKVSTRPGKRARDVHPSEYGETYQYIVDKFWIVDEVVPSGDLILRTRTGKIHSVKPDDPRLRKASWWTRWRYRRRFPDWNETEQSSSPGLLANTKN